MPHSYSDAIRRQAARMPSCWKPDYRIKVAQQTVATNAQHAVTNSINAFALDAMPPPSSLDRAINRFFKGDQMRMTPAPSAAMPASMSPDNFTAGGYRSRNGNGARDQVDPQAVIGYVRMCLQALQDDEQQEAALLQGLADLLDSAMGTAAADQEMQGSSLRLPVGPGVQTGEWQAPEQSSEGSGSERREAWANIANPPLTDRRRLGAGRDAEAGACWPVGKSAGPTPMGGRANDHRPALDSARRARQQEAFLDRFPGARRIQVW